MGERKSTFKVSSEEIQGVGSYVIFRHMTFGTVLQAMSKSGDKTNSKEEKAFTEKLLKEAVIEWDWVDDNGAPLVLPSAGLEIESLLTNEIMWLVSQITGKEQSKNSS